MNIINKIKNNTLNILGKISDLARDEDVRMAMVVVPMMSSGVMLFGTAIVASIAEKASVMEEKMGPIASYLTDKLISLDLLKSDPMGAITPMIGHSHGMHQYLINGNIELPMAATLLVTGIVAGVAAYLHSEKNKYNVTHKSAVELSKQLGESVSDIKEALNTTSERRLNYENGESKAEEILKYNGSASEVIRRIKEQKAARENISQDLNRSTPKYTG
jgi:hypothetical protein